MEEAILILIAVTIVYLIYHLYWHYFPETRSFQQSGGVGVTDGSERLFRDREEYFRFEKGSYPYLNKITKTYQESLSSIEKKIEKIKNFISEFERAKEVINGQVTLTPLYTEADVKKQELEIEQLHQTYNRHLNLFLELADLNNRLLVYEIYSQKSSNSNDHKKRTTRDTYDKKQRALQKSYRELMQK